MSLSNPAKLLAGYMRVTGQYDAKALAEEFGIPVRTIQRLKLDIAVADSNANSANAATDGASTDNGISATTANDAMDGASGAPAPLACAGATKESLRDTYYQEVKILTPTLVEQEPAQARVGEEEVAPGLFVNCKTIRHAAFAINVDAIAMQTIRSGASLDEVKTFCVAHAMQWATEIANGRLSNDVLPSKVANFLATSFMHSHNRGEIADVRKSKATAGPVKSFSDERRDRAKSLMRPTSAEVTA